MAKAWSGDGTYVLPARKVEPYRLWFEFLKIAYKDPDIKVDKRIYKPWGDVENLTFDKWWNANWRDLFAVDAGIRLLEKDENLKGSNSAIGVRIPMSLDENTIIQEIRELIREHGIGNREATRVKGKFALTEGSKQGFEKRMNTARCMLRLYEYWLKYAKLDKRKQVEKATLDYLDWAVDWDNQITSKGWNRPRPNLPNCFRVYGAFIRQKVAGKKSDESMINFKEGNAENARREVTRFIRKARRIAENVGRGEFPGNYG
jgi:hypothetical protein